MICAQENSGDIHSPTHIVLHLGELMLKGRNRGLFVNRLRDNIRAKLDPEWVSKIESQPGRIIVELNKGAPSKAMHQKVSRTSGVANSLLAMSCEPVESEMMELVKAAVSGREFATFAVRCKRADKRFPLRSQDICVKAGALVGELTGAKVNLDKPELTVWIEVLPHRILVGADKREGTHGLPVGMSGRVCALLSGGIDSPVAVWRMLKRGCFVDLVHFHSTPYTSAAAREKAVDLARALSDWHAPLSLALVPFGEIQQAIVRLAPEQYRVLLYRRFMTRIAAELARARGAQALVTGESLAQVASQTLSNLASVEQAIDIPILRPLIGMDKQEIIRDAREIGTYDISIEPHQDCCNYLEPQKPATRSRADQLDHAERALNVEDLVSQGVAGAEWIEIG